MAENNFLPSLFRGLNTKESKTIEWGEVYSLIRSEVMASDTEKYRKMMAAGMEKEA